MTLKELVATNAYKNDITLATELQNEAAFYISYDPSNPHLEKFQRRILSMYVDDRNKFSRFFEVFAGRILPSIEICDTIFSQVYRVWDAQDTVREYNFKNTDLNAEALQYVNKFNDFWLNEYWEAFKHKFNSFIVIDLPEIQSSLRPEPYPFILDISKVKYIVPTDDFEVKEIIFEQLEGFGEVKKKYWYYFTDQFYSKYEIVDDREIEIKKIDHNLGQCPVYKVWNERFNSSWLISKGLILPNFDDFFWFNVKTIESRKADLLYLNPITQMPQISCGFESKKSRSSHYTGEPGKCVGGYMYSEDGKFPILVDNRPVLCPNCGKTRHSGGGAGNMIQINLDSQAIKDGKIDPSDTLVKYITPDIDGVKEQYSRVRELGDYIIKYCVGSDDQPTKSALNELQQQAIFESKESVLKRLSLGISTARTIGDKIMFKLRYQDSFISNKFSQGTKFYLHTVDELLERRMLAKDAIQKKQIDEQIIEVKYRNNEVKLNEEKLLYKLLPYNSLTDEEFTNLVGNNKISDSVVIGLRYQFSNAIELFESTYGSIIEFYKLRFADSVSEIQRVNVIRDLLLQTIKIEQNVQSNLS